MGTDPLCQEKALHAAPGLPEAEDLLYPLSIWAVSLQRERCPARASLAVTSPAQRDASALAARASRQEKLLALTCEQMIKDLKAQLLKAI